MQLLSAELTAEAYEHGSKIFVAGTVLRQSDVAGGGLASIHAFQWNLDGSCNTH